jgi:hypothetical protein
MCDSLPVLLPGACAVRPEGPLLPGGWSLVHWQARGAQCTRGQAHSGSDPHDLEASKGESAAKSSPGQQPTQCLPARQARLVLACAGFLPHLSSWEGACQLLRYGSCIRMHFLHIACSEQLFQICQLFLCYNSFKYSLMYHQAYVVLFIQLGKEPRLFYLVLAMHSSVCSKAL